MYFTSIFTRHSHRLGKKVLLLSLGLLCFAFKTKAQSEFVNSYDASADVTGVTSSKIIETHDHYYVSIGYGKSLTTGYTDLIVNKYDLNGTNIFNKVYDLGASYTMDLIPYSIAENPDPTDFGFAIVGTCVDYSSGTAINNQFVLKIGSTGSVQWFNKWKGNDAHGVVFTHNTSALYDIVVAGSINISASVLNPQITEFSPTGSLVNKATYNMKTNLPVVDMVEIVSTGRYCMLLNDRSVQPAYLHINYTFGGAVYRSIGASLPPNIPVAFVKDETISGHPMIYILAQLADMNIGFRPSIYKVDLATNTVAANYYNNTIYGFSDRVVPTGIARMNYGSGGLMISANHYNSSLVGGQEPVVFTTDLTLALTSPLEIHLNSSMTIPNANYSQITSTFNANDYMITGQIGSLFTLSKVKYDATVPCSTFVAWSANSLSVSLTTNGTLSTFVVALSSPTPALTSPDWTPVIECGCTQIKPKTEYSRVIDGNYLSATFDYARSDYDKLHNRVLVPSTMVDPTSGRHYATLSNIQVSTGNINWTRIHSLSHSDEQLAVKVASNGDIVTVGRTINATGNHVIYVQRRTAADVQVYYNVYDQNNTDVDGFIFITETSVSHDIVVAGCSINFKNSNILIRISATGTTYYYDDHGVFAGGNPDERYPWIFGITPTSDDGYVVVGTTGHQWDYFGATVMKNDVNFNSTFIHAMAWHYIYRHQLSVSYDLTTAGHRSSTYAHAATEDASGNIIVAGYQADNDQYGTSSTYRNGFILRLTSTGALTDINNYVPTTSTDLVSFNGISMSGSDYVVTGSVYDATTGSSKTLVTNISSTTMAPAWSNLYGGNSLNTGWSIFPSPHGYVSVGYSNDYATPEQPNILSIGSTGGLGTCNMGYTLTNTVDANDPPAFTISAPVGATLVASVPDSVDTCRVMVDLCASSVHPVQLTGLDKQLDPNNHTIKCYPNPAYDRLNIDLNAANVSQGTIVITDMQGREVMSRIMDINKGANHTELDISSLNTGLYFVKVTNTANGSYSVNKIQKY